MTKQTREWLACFPSVSPRLQEHPNVPRRPNYTRGRAATSRRPARGAAVLPRAALLSSSVHAVTHTLTYDTHAACCSSTWAGRQSPALCRHGSKRETKSLGWWESAGWPVDFSMCVHFLTINPTVHLAQGVPVMLTMRLEETQHPDNYHPRGNYKEKPMISCHALSNSTNRLRIVASSQRFKHAFSLLCFLIKSCANWTPRRLATSNGVNQLGQIKNCLFPLKKTEADLVYKLN